MTDRLLNRDEYDAALAQADYDYLPSIVERELARSVLTLAATGGMPDTFWLTDSRVALACAVLRITPYEAREWAYEQPRRQ